MSAKLNTDTKKTLEYLQMSGTHGVHSFDLNRYVGTTRAAARVNDLKKLGYTITHRFERKNGSMGVRYFLNGQPKPETPKVIRWEFDNATNTARPIYA